MRVPFFLRPHQHLVLSDFLILAIIMVVQCHLVTLICISFIINNVKFLFMCLQLLILYSFGNICSNLFPFIIGLFDISKQKSSISVGVTRLLPDKCEQNQLLLVCGLTFCSFVVNFKEHNSQVLIKPNISYFLIMDYAFYVLCRKS